MKSLQILNSFDLVTFLVLYVLGIVLSIIFIRLVLSVPTFLKESRKQTSILREIARLQGVNDDTLLRIVEPEKYQEAIYENNLNDQIKKANNGQVFQNPDDWK